MTGERRELLPREREMLDFEREWPAMEGGKNAAVHARFRLTSSRYYTLLNQLLDNPAAEAYDPFTVKRLRRDRDERRRRRVARQLGISL